MKVTETAVSDKERLPHSPPTTTAVSAPGKVLLAGGYLVLDRRYTGTVFALDARIHVIVRQLQNGKGGKAPMREKAVGTVTSEEADGSVLGAGPETGEPMEGIEGEGSVANTDGQCEEQKGRGEEEEVIVVKSPQFVDAVWEYGVQRMGDGGGVKVVQLRSG